MYDFTSALLNTESVLSYKAQVNLTKPFLIKPKQQITVSSQSNHLKKDLIKQTDISLCEISETLIFHFMSLNAFKEVFKNATKTLMLPKKLFIPCLTSHKMQFKSIKDTSRNIKACKESTLCTKLQEILRNLRGLLFIINI